MSDETREKLKDVVKKKPLQTAILTMPEYQSGFEAGRNQAIEDCVSAIKNLICPTHQHSSDVAHAANGAWHQAIKELEALKHG